MPSDMSYDEAELLALADEAEEEADAIINSREISEVIYVDIAEDDAAPMADRSDEQAEEEAEVNVEDINENADDDVEEPGLDDTLPSLTFDDMEDVDWEGEEVFLDLLQRILNLMDMLTSTAPPQSGLTQKQIDNLPHFTITSEELDEDMPCTICYEPYEIDEIGNKFECKVSIFSHRIQYNFHAYTFF